MLELTNDLIHLSLSKSLIGCVRTDLKAVLYSIYGTAVSVRIILDHPPSADDRDFYSEALLDFYAHIWVSETIKINEVIEFRNGKLSGYYNDGESIVFLRYEEDDLG